MGRIETKSPDVDSILKFLRGLSPIQPSFGTNRKSNVAPSLTAHERHKVDKFFQHRDHSDRAVAEKEAADAIASKDGDIPTTTLERQIGRPMHSSEVSKRLLKLNSNFVFERSIAFPSIMGIYMHDPNAEMRDGRRLRHIAGFEFNMSPEFTVYHNNTKGPKKVTRGWRALILILSNRGLIDITRAAEIFDIERGQARKRWHEEVKKLKRRR